MRVALVSAYDWSVPGGAQGQVAAIAGALVRRGEEVAVVTPQRNAAAAPVIEGVRVYPAGRGVGVRVNGSVAPVAFTPAAWVDTFRALRSFRPDVVHVHEPLVPGPPLAALLAGPKPIVATFHRSGVDALYRLEGALLGLLLQRRCAAATAVSREAIDTARAVLGERLPRLTEVPNGVEVARFERARRAQQGAAEDGLFKNGGVARIAFVGRLEKRKGASVLLAAAHDLPESVVVQIGGDGPEAGALKEAAGSDPQVEFLGRLSDDEVAELMAAADIAVAPALGGESFGIVLLEAMAAGTAVVASDIAGYRLAAGGAARLVAADDPSGLARALNELLADHDRRAQLAEAGMARARELSIDSIVERYLELYASVLAAGG